MGCCVDPRMARKKKGVKRPLHLVIGAGPGGILCSHELAKHGDVLLFESGTILTSDETTNIDPREWGTAFATGKHTKHLETIPQEGLFARKILYPCGSSVGGSSNINAMIFSGGHPAVFDNFWPPEWNSERVSRYRYP
jgi:choline dehydrogenase-like flavoprotein